ncbi:predicted protein [Streptomyces viridochromogenes DSM 40736]|uniref:Predicted protein n=1 Tax=Streptomyces viridochromogenes (strain DSM 40736 / JCM 4977 / BCRC 1201 / Tue 494) TaxID=591159 RepID=D9XD44_STRVT|nr:predicted protein [Streptomyces viridochromogenes DSM 40736]
MRGDRSGPGDGEAAGDGRPADRREPPRLAGAGRPGGSREGEWGAVDHILIAVALVLVAAGATVAVATRDPARQSLVLAVLGVLLAVLFTVLQAPDVALSQLAVGSALTPLLLLLTVRKVRRRGQREGDDE